MEMCFYVPGDTSIIDIARPDGRSSVYGHTLAQVRERYPGAQFLPFPDASQAARAALDKKYSRGVPREVTRDEWQYALEVLPPCAWTRDRNGERFFVSELQYADVASWYVRIGKRYFTVNDRVSTSKEEMYSACHSLIKKLEKLPTGIQQAK